MAASQLGSGWDVVDEDESQPLPGGDAAGESQPLPVGSEPMARFVCLYGMNHGAVQQFNLLVRHGEKAYLGRTGPSAVDPSRRVTLTTSASHGISRDNGWLEYDKFKGVILVPLQRVGFPAFVNGALLTHNSSAVILKDGDEVGFGGSHGGELTATTVRYRCDFRNMPPLQAAMPPPPPMPAARVASAEAGPNLGAQPAEGRGRGGGTSTSSAATEACAEATTATTTETADGATTGTGGQSPAPPDAARRAANCRGDAAEGDLSCVCRPGVLGGLIDPWRPDPSWRREPCGCHRGCGRVTLRTQCGEIPELSRP